MKFINKTNYLRLQAQKSEAENQGLTKTAASLTSILESSEPVEDKSFVYPDAAFASDVESSLWSIMVKASTFYGVNLDVEKAEELISFAKDALLNEFKETHNVSNDIGKFEGKLPGEDDLVVEL
jgi:hypothetical protein